MTYHVSFHEAAEMELNEAAEFYETQIKGLGSSFLAEVERSLGLLLEHPESFPRIHKVVRKCVVRRFPFDILYSIKDDSIFILALAHHKRRPYYWRTRRP